LGQAATSREVRVDSRWARAPQRRTTCVRWHHRPVVGGGAAITGRRRFARAHICFKQICLQAHPGPARPTTVQESMTDDTSSPTPRHVPLTLSVPYPYPNQSSNPTPKSPLLYPSRHNRRRALEPPTSPRRCSPPTPRPPRETSAPLTGVAPLPPPPPPGH
jgi:hypothetical protein